MTARRRPLGPWLREEAVIGLGPFARACVEPEQLHDAVCSGRRITGTDPMTIHPDYIGIDISKAALDIFEPKAGFARIANTSEAIAQWLRSRPRPHSFIVMEATGHYDRALRQALDAADMPYARLNPTQARRFAQAVGRLAKTDRIDAAMLAELGARLQPTAHTIEDPARNRLSLLHKRRDQLVDQRAMERVRLSELAEPDPLIIDTLDSHLDWLDAAIKTLDDAIAELINAAPELKAHQALLRSAPGIGPVAATTLMALMPELGTRRPGAVAALAGLAPFNCDSGSMRGVRRIAGGRRRVRKALYMSALAAVRSSRRYAAIYQRLLKAGKAKKLALIAVARKLLIAINAMLRDGKAFAE